MCIPVYIRELFSLVQDPNLMLDRCDATGQTIESLITSVYCRPIRQIAVTLWYGQLCLLTDKCFPIHKSCQLNPYWHMDSVKGKQSNPLLKETSEPYVLLTRGTFERFKDAVDISDFECLGLSTELQLPGHFPSWFPKSEVRKRAYLFYMF